MCMRRLSMRTRMRARVLHRLCRDSASGRTAAAECGMCRCAANSKAFFSCDRAHVEFVVSFAPFLAMRWRTDRQSLQCHDNDVVPSTPTS